MKSITGTVQDGQIVPDARVDWPNGTPVEIAPCQGGARPFGIGESAWRDDPESLADWEAWLKTLEPLEFTPEEAAEAARFQAEMRRFNLEAVRRQMEERAP
ncbi:MAG TPA: hypothetical protein VG013_12580 [Gemmataceae bacterium]|nr:hypothetical protein [Gemmataceae bacterium]